MNQGEKNNATKSKLNHELETEKEKHASHYCTSRKFGKAKFQSTEGMKMWTQFKLKLKAEIQTKEARLENVKR